MHHGAVDYHGENIILGRKICAVLILLHEGQFPERELIKPEHWDKSLHNQELCRKLRAAQGACNTQLNSGKQAGSRRRNYWEWIPSMSHGAVTLWGTALQTITVWKTNHTRSCSGMILLMDLKADRQRCAGAGGCTVTLMGAVSGNKNGNKSQSWHIAEQFPCWGLNMIPKFRSSCYYEHLQPKKLIFLYTWEHHGIILLSNCVIQSVQVKNRTIKNSSAGSPVK